MRWPRTGDTAVLCLSSRYSERANDLAAQYKTRWHPLDREPCDRAPHLALARVDEPGSFPAGRHTHAHAAAANRQIAERLNLAKGLFAASGITLDWPTRRDTTFSRYYPIHRFDDI